MRANREIVLMKDSVEPLRVEVVLSPLTVSCPVFSELKNICVPHVVGLNFQNR